jgi:hypothetical protein
VRIVGTGTFKQIKTNHYPVISVVVAGKVDIWFKLCMFSTLPLGKVFQNVAVQMRRIGKPGFDCGKKTPVSHVSHRSLKSPCVNLRLYVDRKSRPAWRMEE